MFKKYLTHFYLALIFFVLSIGQQYLFYALKGLPIIWLTSGKYLTIFIFFLVFTFIQNEKLRLFWMSYLLILNFFQMSHLSYFGTQILPNEIYLFFSESHEIFGVLSSEAGHVVIPLVFTIIPLAVGRFAIKKLSPSRTFKVLHLIILLYFIYNPIRTFFTGNTWGRQPSTTELSGMNMYLSVSYFAGRILPTKLLEERKIEQKNLSTNLVLNKSHSKWDKVIVVLGESLSPDHMSLFDYKRETTPFLASLKNNKNFFFRKGLSSGVSTDISVAFFLNLTYGDAAIKKIAMGDHCLFKLAKELDYSTHFLSIQSTQQLRYISPYLCSKSLDDLRSFEELKLKTKDANAALDRELLPSLNQLLQSDSKQFIILHQRGSHGPWELRSNLESKKFNDSKTDKRINDYDNSVVEFDFFWKEFYTLLSKQKSKILVLYLSDHGESAGRDQKYGHGFLAPSSFEIPMLFFSFNKDLPKKTKSLPGIIPQYNFSLYLVNEMGWNTNQSSSILPSDYVIYGNDIDGFAGKAEINFIIQDKYDFKKTKSL